MTRMICSVALVAALPLTAWAQDAVKVDPSHYKVVLDNAAVRVLRVAVAPGEKTPSHSHPDGVLVMLTDGKVRFTMPDGKTQDTDLKSETSVYAPAETHAGANVGAAPFEAILVEIKSKAAKATLPATRPGMSQTVLAEGPLATSYRNTAAADFAEAPGSTHDYDQVVIALGPSSIVLSVGGKTVRSSWKRGDVEFVGRGVKHESKNTGGKPVDHIIVAVK